LRTTGIRPLAMLLGRSTPLQSGEPRGIVRR
jgi:hypothetical protein